MFISFVKGKSNLYGLSVICLMLRILFYSFIKISVFINDVKKNTNFKFLLLKTSDTPLIQCFLGCLYFTEFPFEYSGYRASYFCCTIYIYIFTHIHQIYIYFGRFAAWITYSKFTRKYTLFLAYTLKYRNFNSTSCMYAYYFLLHTFAGVERFARLQILYYLLYLMYAFLGVQ